MFVQQVSVQVYMSPNVSSEPIWHFDDQFWKSLFHMNLTLRTGDHIQTTCVFNSMGRSEPTRMGPETTDEMCINRFQSWPGTVQADCKGPVWFGDLDSTEAGIGLASRHPMVDSKSAVWDGENPAGGKQIRGPQESAGPDKCTDNHMMAAMDGCSKLMQRKVPCDMDLGAASAEAAVGGAAAAGGGASSMMPGTTILNYCCTMACAAHCSQHKMCIAAGKSKPLARSQTKATSTLQPAQADTSPTANTAMGKGLILGSIVVLGCVWP
jgi:hypothetical protein